MGNPPGTAVERNNARAGVLGGISIPAAPKSPVDPKDDPVKVEEEKRKKAAKAASNSTVLTSPSGVLGDPPLDRPTARTATVLG